MDIRPTVVLICGVVLSCAGQTTGPPKAENAFITQEHKLKQDLLKDYDKDIFPTKTANDTLDVKLGLALVRMAEVDEWKQHLTLNTWLRFMWTDFRLKWDPKNYDGVSVIRLPNKYVWQPDISLYNSASDDPLLQNDHTHILIYSNGMVLFIPPAMINTHCDFDLTFFPYDSHTCSFKFGSWTYDGYRLNLTLYENRTNIDLADFTNNIEWEVTSSEAKRNKKYYPCCREPYIDVTFNLTFTRRSTFFVHFYISPAVAMFIIIPFIFLIKPGSMARSILGVGILIGSLLLLTSVIDLPTFVDRTPVVMVYYSSILTIITTCLILCYIIDQLWVCERHTGPSECIRRYFIIPFGKIVCVDIHEPMTHSTLQLELDDENPDQTGIQPSAHPQSQVHLEVRAQWKACALILNRVCFLGCLILNAMITFITFA